MLYYGGDLFYFLSLSALQFIYGLLHFVPWGLTFLYKLRRNSTVRPPYLHSGLFRVAQAPAQKSSRHETCQISVYSTPYKVLVGTFFFLQLISWTRTLSPCDLSFFSCRSLPCVLDKCYASQLERSLAILAVVDVEICSLPETLHFSRKLVVFPCTFVIYSNLEV